MPTLPAAEVDESVCSDEGDTSEAEEIPAQSTPIRATRANSSAPQPSPSDLLDLTARGFNGEFNSELASPAAPKRRRQRPVNTPVPIRGPKPGESLSALRHAIRRWTRAGDPHSRSSQPRPEHSHFERCLWWLMYSEPRVVRFDRHVPIIVNYKNTRNLALCHIKGECDMPGPTGSPIRLAVLVDMNSIGFTTVNGVLRSDRSR